MATTTTITKLLFRRGNDADRKKTILASGEPGFALDTGRMWLGDGSTPGGIPIIASADHHLNYIDEYGNVEGNMTRQQLDVNVAGLSATFAGDREFPLYARSPKLFHPADRIIQSEFPIHLTGQYDGTAVFSDGTSDEQTTGSNLSLQYTGEASKAFTIGRTNAGMINIGNILLIDTETGTVSLNAGGRFEVSAVEQIFADGKETLFEDKSVDLNIPVEPGEGGTQERLHYPDPLAEAATANGTGLYYAHMGVASAGKVAVAPDKTQESFNTVQVRPPAFHPDWAGANLRENRLSGKLGIYRPNDQSVYIDGPHHPMPRIAHELNDSGNAPKMSTWVGGEVHKSENGAVPLQSSGKLQYACKNINLRSARLADKSKTFYSDTETAININMGPSKGVVNVASRAQDNDRLWQGDVDLIFETGLLVYGPGDLSVQAQSELNGYLINQSLDSLAVPTFQGINIEGPNSKPLQVPSGGTGKSNFDEGQIIMSNRTEGQDPMFSLGCTPGNLIGSRGNGSGDRQVDEVTITSGNPDWLKKTHSSGNIVYTNTFAPNATTTPSHGAITNQPKQMFFDKFINILDDGNNKIKANRFDGQLKIEGNGTNNKIADIITKRGNTSSIGALLQNNSWQDNGPISSIQIDHYKFSRHGGLWSKINNPTETEFTFSPEAIQDTTTVGENDAHVGRVISRLKVNESGHLMDMQTKDLDDRYPQLFHLGTKTRKTTRVSAPDDVACQRTGQSPHIGLDNKTPREDRLISGDASDTTTQQYITNIEFNDYGTVHSTTQQDLKSIFLTRHQSNMRLRKISTMFDEVYGELAVRVHKNQDSDVNAQTNWLNNNAIGFGPAGTPKGGIKYYDNGVMRIGSVFGSTNRNEELQLYQSSGGLRDGKNAKITLRVGGSETTGVQMRVTRSAVVFTPGTKTESVLSIVNNQTYQGIFMGGYGRYGRSGASSTHLYGTATHAKNADKVDVEEVGEYMNKNFSVNDVAPDSGINPRPDSDLSEVFDDPNATLHPTFVIPVTHENHQGINSRSGYRQILADNDLMYNPHGNWFGNSDISKIKFLGDGTGLDLSRNTTIPPSVELETAGNGIFNVVLSSSPRDKIYDRTNTIQVDSSAGHLYVKGDVVGYNNFSDKRLKKNIVSLNSAESLDKVLQLSGVTFEWKGAPERGERVGLIAQQVEEIVPQVVTESPRADDMNKTYKQVDYEALVPLLIESIKELTARVAELEAR